MIVRRGITRTVLITRHRAYKLPSLRPYGGGLRGLLWSVCRGILANQAEAEWWQNARPETRRLLCPVLRSWLGGVVNVYPRCQPFRATPAQELAMFERRWFPVVIEPAPGDEKAENYGWLTDGRYGGERRLVRLDYDMNWNGCPHDRSGVSNVKR